VCFVASIVFHRVVYRVCRFVCPHAIAPIPKSVHVSATPVSVCIPVLHSQVRCLHFWKSGVVVERSTDRTASHRLSLHYRLHMRSRSWKKIERKRLSQSHEEFRIQEELVDVSEERIRSTSTSHLEQ
jgi:hypothetical protein